MKKKVLFLDLDGTMIWPGSTEMPESTQEALNRARANGHRAIICTGRNLGFTRPLLPYGFDGIICSAGGYVQIGDQVIRDVTMSREEQERTFRILKENGFCFTAETKEDMYVDEDTYTVLAKLGKRSGNSELARLRKQADEDHHCRPLGTYKGEPVYKILLLCTDDACFDAIQGILGDRYDFVRHPKDSDGIVNGELVDKRIGKGKALQLVADYLGVEIEDTLGFGDSMNDIELFRAAGTSVCMGDAPEVLREMVDYVCPKQAEDGLYHGFRAMKLMD